MNKKDIKKALETIEPDAHLETRLKAKVHSKSTRKICSTNAKKGVLAALSLCLCCTIVFGMGIKNFTIPGKESTTSTKLSEKQEAVTTAHLTVMASSYNNSAYSYNSLMFNHAQPYEMLFEFTNINGFTQEQINDERNKFEEAQNNFMVREAKWKYMRSGICRCTDDILLLQCSAGGLKLKPDEAKVIEKISFINTSKYGKVVYWDNGKRFDIPPTISIQGKDFSFEEHSFFWEHTEEMGKYFSENQTPVFSDFNDTITFTVFYTDGTSEGAVIKLNFSEDGTATVTQIK